MTRSKRSAQSSRTVKEYFTAYVYYLRYDEQGTLVATRAYEYFDIKKKINQPEAKIRQLARNAYFDRDNPPCYATSVDGLFRRRKGYVAFVIDSAYHHVSSENDVVLTMLDGSVATAFSNPRYLEFSTNIPGNQVTVPTVYFENEMSKAGANGPEDLCEKEHQDFSLRINRGGGRGFRVEDSGGTNMGPPVPPPGRR